MFNVLNNLYHYIHVYIMMLINLNMLLINYFDKLHNYPSNDSLVGDYFGILYTSGNIGSR
jgi:hypothetical protein